MTTTTFGGAGGTERSDRPEAIAHRNRGHAPQRTDPDDRGRLMSGGRRCTCPADPKFAMLLAANHELECEIHAQPEPEPEPEKAEDPLHASLMSALNRGGTDLGEALSAKLNVPQRDSSPALSAQDVGINPPGLADDGLTNALARKLGVNTTTTSHIEDIPS